MEHETFEQAQSGTDEQMRRAARKYYRDARNRVEKCLQDYKVYDNANLIAKYLTSRPLLLAGVIAVISSIALPVILFAIFAITTVACTFAGFIIIEGTILAFGTLILCGVLLSIITTILMLGTCLALAHYVFLKMYNVLRSI